MVASSSVYRFFFSSRRRHTRFDCDWSSDVCSSDLLLQSSFDFNASQNISPTLAAYANFPDSLGPVGLDLSRNLLAGINFAISTSTPDTLDLYDISDPANPLLLAQYNFSINHVANNNFIGRVLL